MRRILVTGANKGIGLAIAQAILEHADDTFVFLGARDEGRGRRAIDALAQDEPSWRERTRLVKIDVANDASVLAARDAIAGVRLYGVVNNAGMGSTANDLAAITNVNTRGVHRVCEAMLPLLEPAGRIANVTSASGPSFVEKCSPERRRFFVDPATDWPAIERLLDECIAIAASGRSFGAEGLGSGDAYGLSKACANTYTQHLAQRHPSLSINACTPGFIETDMTRHYAETQRKTPAELGMKSPAEGARSAMHLLFGELEGNGRFYGSDAQRSPLNRYRSPGTPAYSGD